MNAHQNFARLACLMTASVAFAQVSTPPAAPVRPVTDDYFGTKVVDNYRYFEDLKNPDDAELDEGAGGLHACRHWTRCPVIPRCSSASTN